MFPKNKLYSDHKKDVPPKLIILFKPLLFVLLFCGFNYNFYKCNRILKLLVKLYCGLLSVVTAVASITCCPASYGGNLLSLTEYFACIHLLLCIKDKTLIFFNKLQDIDSKLRIPRNYYDQTKFRLYLFVFIIWFVRIAYTASYCYYYICFKYFILYLFDCFVLLSLDVNRAWRFVIFDIVRYRLSVLRKRLEEHSTENIYLHVIDKRHMVKENKLKLCLRLYKEIGDSMALVNPGLHASFFVSVCCSLPKVVFNVYLIMLITKEHVPVITVGFVILHLTQIAFFLFSPCVIVELYNVEVERMRLFLINWFASETDETVKDDIKTFLFYTTVRPIKYNIWRMFAINIRLPLNLIGLCTTYVVVLIQFSHIFE